MARETINIPDISDKLFESVSTELRYGKGLLPFSGISIPNCKDIKSIVELSRAVMFPEYSIISLPNEDKEIARTDTLHRLYKLLCKQIFYGLTIANQNTDAFDLSQKTSKLTIRYIKELPVIQKVLATDIIATFEGDPAAKSVAEVLCCYPGIRAILNYRIAHFLLLSRIPLLPRIISEIAHSETGIDIHPGAKIANYFSIDHGTGVVIGETCIIGEHVRLYQGVTLGARNFPLDKEGNPVKGIPRHPIVEDNVIIYSNATILGRVHIGKDSTIGGNVWITADIPPGSKVLQQKPVETLFFQGGGI